MTCALYSKVCSSIQPNLIAVQGQVSNNINTSHCKTRQGKLIGMKDGIRGSNQPCIRPRTAPLASPPTTEFMGSSGLVARASLASSRAPGRQQ
jgi:hypothetical protein